MIPVLWCRSADLDESRCDTVGSARTTKRSTSAIERAIMGQTTRGLERLGGFAGRQVPALLPEREGCRGGG